MDQTLGGDRINQEQRFYPSDMCARFRRIELDFSLTRGCHCLLLPPCVSGNAPVGDPSPLRPEVLARQRGRDHDDWLRLRRQEPAAQQEVHIGGPRGGHPRPCGGLNVRLRSALGLARQHEHRHR